MCSQSVVRQRSPRTRNGWGNESHGVAEPDGVHQGSRAARASAKGQGRHRISQPAVLLCTGPASAARPHLSVPAGQSVALVGSTGAGKTTIAKLIARSYDPNRDP